MRERAEVQTEIVIDGTSLVLSPAQDVAALRESIQRAVATAGTFVDFTTARGGLIPDAPRRINPSSEDPGTRYFRRTGGDPSILGNYRWPCTHPSPRGGRRPLLKGLRMRSDPAHAPGV